MSLNLDKSKWTRVKLGDVAAASKEKVDPSAGDVDRYIAGEHMDTDDLRINRWGDAREVDLGPAFHRRFRPGQVLYGSRRTYLRKVAVAEFDGVCANTTFVVETTDEEALLQAFLPFVMTSEAFHAFAIGESKGSVNPYVNWSDIARYEFDLPPIEEQERLADLLWAVEKHLRSLKLSVAPLKTAAKALVEAQLAGSPRFPLEKYAELKSGKSVPSTLYGREGVRLIKAGDLKPSGLVAWTEQSVFIPDDFAQKYPDKLLEPGNLVINMTAQSLDDGFLGRVCLLNDEAFLNQRIGLLQSSQLRNDYLHVVLRLPEFTNWVARRSEGSKVKHMHWRHIADYPLPVPEESVRDAVIATSQATKSAQSALIREIDDLSTLRSAFLNEIFGDN